MITVAILLAFCGGLALAWENGTLALACVGGLIILICMGFAP